MIGTVKREIAIEKEIAEKYIGIFFIKMYNKKIYML